MGYVKAMEECHENGGSGWWSVFIDDTGPGGRSQSPETLPGDRETHVAAVFPPDGTRKLQEQFPGVQADLRDLHGVSEFHCTHIYNGKGRFRDVSIEDRLNLLRFLFALVEDADVRFIVQSFDSKNSANVIERASASELGKIPHFDVGKLKDLTLVFLLLRVRDYLRDEDTGPAVVFIDEGWKKANRAVPLPWNWSDVVHENQIVSADSSAIAGLQLADFGAFILNRSQMLVGKTGLSDLDLQVMELWEDLSRRFVNLSPVEYDLVDAEEGPRFVRVKSR